MSHKLCNRCQNTKDIIEFSRRSRSTDGRQSACKACMKNTRQKKISVDKDSRIIEIENSKILISTPYVQARQTYLDTYLADMYQKFISQKIPVVASILNAIVAQKKSHFRLSRKVLDDLVRNDPNIPKKLRFLGRGSLPKIQAILAKYRLASCIQQHDRKNASVWTVDDEMIINYLNDIGVDFDTQKEAAVVKRSGSLMVIGGGKAGELRQARKEIGTVELEDLIKKEQYFLARGKNLDLNAYRKPRDWNEFRNKMIDQGLTDIDDRIRKARVASLEMATG